MIKLTKRQAKRRFNQGFTILLKTSRVTEQMIDFSPYLFWFELKKSVCDEQGETFDSVVNAYSYYNCNKELGLRVNYYIYSQ